MRSENLAEYRELLKKAKSQGWLIGKTGNNHLKLVSPTGQQIITSGTPGDRRGFWNFRARLRREGLEV